MSGEQLAFFNHQLAGMLRSGIPLEAALRQLCQGMSRGRWRDELEKLRVDLEQGTPLDQALRQRQLPAVYAQLLRIGAVGNDLPGTLTVAADYFAGHHQFWSRFRATLLYPVIVLCLALLVCVFMIVLHSIVRDAFYESPMFSGAYQVAPAALRVAGWFSPAVILFGLALVGVVAFVRPVQFTARWFVPGWKEGTLAQLSSSIALLLRGGTSFPEALKLVAQLEPCRGARGQMEEWVGALARGQTDFSQFARGSRYFPPLFIWLVAGAGEDLAVGFERAAELYRARARYRLDLFLFGLMPAAVVLLGVLLLAELAPFVAHFTALFETLGEP